MLAILAERPDDAMETTQCRLCEAFVCDTFERRYDTVVPRYGLFVYRWDLLDYVCGACDRTLGPDPLRVKAMETLADRTILPEYLARYA